MRDILAPFGSLADWQMFADSWNSARDRLVHGRRRTLSPAAPRRLTPPRPTGAIRREPHQPHYQSLDYNPLHGGIERWFEPVRDEVGQQDTMTTMLECCRSLFGELAPEISPVARSKSISSGSKRVPGRLDSRHPKGCTETASITCWCCSSTAATSPAASPASIDSTASRSDRSRSPTPLDAAFVDDRRVAHGVTPVEPLDPASRRTAMCWW